MKFQYHPEFLKDMQRLYSDHPWWRFHRFLTDLRWLHKEPIYAWQRARRGYSDRDLWSLDYYLAHILVGALPHYREHPKCYTPQAEDCISEDEWNRIIDEMIAGFSTFMTDDIELPERYALRARANHLLAEHMSALWT